MYTVEKDLPGMCTNSVEGIEMHCQIAPKIIIGLQSLFYRHNWITYCYQWGAVLIKACIDDFVSPNPVLSS